MGFSEDDRNDQQADDVDKYEREHRELELGSRNLAQRKQFRNMNDA